jgi:hypothetical protein
MGGVMIGFRVQKLRVLVAMVVAAVGVSLVLAGGAWGFTEPGITGTYSDFTNCPSPTVSPNRGCLHVYTKTGVVQIGNATVPISVPGITLDMAVVGEEGRSFESPECEAFDALVGDGEEGCVVSPPHGVLNGPAQPVPGGLLGTLGNMRLGAVTAKVEWAAPPPPNKVFGVAAAELPVPFFTLNENALLSGADVVVAVLSVKFHLMNPFLGANCYIGSAQNPVVIELTQGTTSPPPPNKPLIGKPSRVVASKEGRIAQLTGGRLVANSFAVPAASGCGNSSAGGLLDGAIDRKLSLPSPAGHNAIVVEPIAEQVATSILVDEGVV